MEKITGKLEAINAKQGSEGAKVGGKWYNSAPRAREYIPKQKIGSEVVLELDSLGLISFIGSPKREFIPTKDFPIQPAPMGLNRDDTITRLACIKAACELHSGTNLPVESVLADAKKLEKYAKGE